LARTGQKIAPIKRNESKFIKLILTLILFALFSKIVGMYSSSNLSSANLIKRHVLPAAPSPTTTNFDRIQKRKISKNV
jgi:hypothetical protein